MKGMTNNQIIMNEAAKLDPATLHAIATAHHTPEQIAAMAANAVTTDENGDEQPATIADVEIIRQAQNAQKAGRAVWPVLPFVFVRSGFIRCRRGHLLRAA